MDGSGPAVFEAVLKSEQLIENARDVLDTIYSGQSVDGVTDFTFTDFDDLIMAVLHILVTCWIIAIVVADITNRWKSTKRRIRSIPLSNNSRYEHRSMWNLAPKHQEFTYVSNRLDDAYEEVN